MSGHPGNRGTRIGQRLVSGECFRRDGEKRGCRIQLGQGIFKMRAVYIRHKMHTWTVSKFCQCGTDEFRPQQRTTDAQIHHIGKYLIGRTANFSAANRRTERFYAIKLGANLRAYIRTVYQ